MAPPDSQRWRSVSYFNYIPPLPLVLGAEKVVDGLYRVEC